LDTNHSSNSNLQKKKKSVSSQARFLDYSFGKNRPVFRTYSRYSSPTPSSEARKPSSRTAFLYAKPTMARKSTTRITLRNIRVTPKTINNAPVYTGCLAVYWTMVYLRFTKGKSFSGKYGMPILSVILLIMNAYNVFGPTPTSTEYFAVMMLAALVFTSVVAFWLDRKRS
jgi:transposase-like protein